MWYGEIVNKRKDGKLYIEEMTISPVVEDEGKVTHFIAIKQDITSRRLAEEKLRESEERLNFAMNTSHTGVWDLNLLDHTAFRSLEHDRIFGYPKLLPEWTYEMFLDHVLQEDREEVSSRFNYAINNKSDWSFRRGLRLPACRAIFRAGDYEAKARQRRYRAGSA